MPRRRYRSMSGESFGDRRHSQSFDATATMVNTNDSINARTSMGANSVVNANGNKDEARTPSVTMKQAQQSSAAMLQIVNHLTDGGSGMTFLHHRHANLTLAKSLLDRARWLDDAGVHSSSVAVTMSGNASNRRRTNSHSNIAASSSAASVSADNKPSSSMAMSSSPSLSLSMSSASFQRDFLLHQEWESGYNPLHSAIIHADLPRILLFLRHISTEQERFVQRPMNILQTSEDTGASILSLSNGDGSSNTSNGRRRQRSRTDSMSQPNNGNNDSRAMKSVNNPRECLIRSIMTQEDREGLTPLQLLGKLQTTELRACRASIARPTVHYCSSNSRSAAAFSSNRRTSFDATIHPDSEDENEDDFHFLNDNINVLNDDSDNDDGDAQTKRRNAYACEVITFGRPQHCALGVHSGTSHGGGMADSKLTSTSGGMAMAASASFRPQRVKEFAQDTVGRLSSAVAVAAAAHHTLVVQRDGALYAFGLGKGGRLGVGNDQNHCPLPMRVSGPLSRRRVVAVAAAENHSLCVTSEGQVYSWGSNRFGQLGMSNGTSTNKSTSSSSSDMNANCRYLPRRVEDLKQAPCVAVAAGERHSIALSRRGEVYVWGDNSSGQLGVSRKTGIQRVQRVESLWNTEKVTIQIAASAQSTLVLCGASRGMHVNTIYSWGHGNHVPIKVHFDDDSKQQDFATDRLSTKHVRNPVSIACAKFHNAAITSDGHVYTWGFHAESLGRTNSDANKSSSSSTSMHQQRKSPSSPQLVTDLLPENGGGLAVALSASEHHTAVVTDTGALYTWGAADGKNVLGHEGQRWLPSPKQVPGIHRAVSVAVAKEHTVVLVGASFPSLLHEMDTLEHLATRRIVEHVDLFNVLPILILAERTESHALIKHCMEFIRLNLDGVLNLAQRSVMNQYLDDMLSDSLYHSRTDFRDGSFHPFITDIIDAGTNKRPTFGKDWFCSHEEWVKACHSLSMTDMARLSAGAAARRDAQVALSSMGARRQRGASFNNFADGRKRGNSVSVSYQDKESLDQIIASTTNMDLSSSTLANCKLEWLNKEIRGTKKRLNQIAKLEQSDTNDLTHEQRGKITRKNLLQTKLDYLEKAMRVVEKRMGDFVIPSKKQPSNTTIGCDAVKVQDANGKTLLKTLGTKSQQEADPASQQSEDGEHATAPAATTTTNTKSYYCGVCCVKCQDETSYVLHNNGRKHRNRVSQAAEAEKATAAATILAQKQKQQLMVSTSQEVQPTNRKPTKLAWASAATPKSVTPTLTTTTPAAAAAATSPKPKYTLPPPPHTTGPGVIPSMPKKQACGSPITKSSDLRSIMQEQDRKSKKTKKGTLPTPKTIRTKVSLRDIMAGEQRSASKVVSPGASPSVKTMTTAATAKASTGKGKGGAKTMAVPSLKQPRSSKKKASSSSQPHLHQSKLQAGQHGSWNAMMSASRKSPSTSRTLATTTTAGAATAEPLSTRCVPANLLAPSPSTKAGGGDDPYSLAAFLTPTKTPTPKPSKSPWSTPKAKRQPPPIKTSSPFPEHPPATPKTKSTPTSKSLRDIQQEETDFKARQDETFGKGAGSWYIGRRERAGSFRAIQTKELMIQEQYEIEAQIRNEVEDAKRKATKKKKGRKGNRKRGKNAAGGKMPQPIPASS